MRSHAEVDIFEVPELSTPVYRSALIDDLGEPVQGALLTTLTLTVLQEYTLAVVNGRDGQNVLNTNGVTIDTDGMLRWGLTVDDTVILNDALRKEMHRALFAWTFDSGTKSGNKEVIIMITNRVGL